MAVTQPPNHIDLERLDDRAVRRMLHLIWACEAILVFFAVPWIATRNLGLGHRGYLALHAVVSVLFLMAFVATAEPDLSVLRKRWKQSVVLGLFVGATISVLVVLLVEPTQGVSGWSLALAVAGRGVGLGLLSATVLIGVPTIVARELTLDAPPRVRWLARGVLTAVLVTATLVAHDLGFEQYETGDARPDQAASVASAIPAIVTGNPAGAVVAHVAWHVTTTVHAFETEVLVPPAVVIDRDYRPPGLFLPPELSDLGIRLVGYS